MKELQQADLEERAQGLLQASAEQLDGRTRSRLTQARHAALNAIKQRQGKSWFWLMPGAGAAATAIAAVMLINRPTPVPQMEQGVATAVVDELEIVTSEDSLEFYRDVEFYAWLETVMDEEVVPESEA